MRSSRFGVAADVAIAVALFGVAALTLLRATDSVPFHGDESEWINASRYFKYLFLDRDTGGQVWRPSFITRDQPPLGRYVIGAVIWALGNDPLAVNRSYAWSKDLATNEQEGRVPPSHLLQPVRRTMAVLGAASIVGLYVVGRLLDGPISGAVAALFATASPLLQSYFAQARSESLLAVLTVLALIGAMVVARRFGERGEVPGLGWLAGLVLGLALATKLTAALAVVGTGAYGGAAMLNRWVGEARERQRMAAWTVVTGASAAVVFLVVNPFLWPDPVARTFSMLDQQQAIMREQGQQFGGATTGDSWARGALVIRRTFVENSIPAFDAGLPPGSEPVVQKTFLDLPAPGGLSLELALSAIGLLALCWRAARSWRPGERLGGETALLCWLAAYFAGIAGYLSLDWPRYYVPTAFLGSLLIGLAVGALARGALDLFLDRTPMGAAAQRPAPTGLRYRSRVWR